MPSIVDEFVPFRSTLPQPDRPDEQTPGIGATLGAAGTLANWPYRSWRYLANRAESEADPDHDPFALIEGTKYATDPERFAHSRDEIETRAIMREWDDDEAAADTLSRAGWAGTVAAVGMGMADPTIFLPIAKVFTGAAQGAHALRMAGDVALASGASAAIGEAAMAATTPNYGAGDVAIGIGSATLLGGLLGGGVGLLTQGERRALTENLDADRKVWGAEIDADATPSRPVNALPHSAGAAATDTRKLELNTPGILKALPDPTAKVSPPRRVLNSPFQSARRAVVDLVETPYVFKENLDGVATTQGPALDRSVKLEINSARVALLQQFDNGYSRYRFGKEAKPWSTERAGQLAARAMDHSGRPRSKASYAEFRSMVDQALRNGDKHDIPEVAETARFMRDRVIAPWRERAIAAKMLPEGVDVSTADSYWMRVWNKERLIAQRPQALKIFGDWLEAEEAKKAALRDEIADLSAQLDAAAQMSKGLQRKGLARLGKDFDTNKAAAHVLDNQNTALRQRLEAAVAKWEGKSARGAQKALAEREAAGPRIDGEQHASADTAINDAVRRILAKERLRDRQEIDALAQEIIDRIVGGPDGRLPYDAHSAPWSSAPKSDARGPLAARDFMIPDALIRDFLDTDALNTADIYLNTMAPDVLLTERFGDVNMSDAMRQLKDEAAALEIAAPTEAERTKIGKQKAAAEADLAAMRDRIRHTYGVSSDPRQRFIGRMAVTASRYDIMTNLGGATLSSLSDLAGAQWRYGFGSVLKRAWLPFAKSINDPVLRKALKSNKEQLRALGIAAETLLATRAGGLHDITDGYRPTSRFERGMKVASEKFGLVNLLGPYTDFGRLAAGMVSSAEIVKASRALTVGKATRKQVRSLAESGIDVAMAERITRQLEAADAADVIDGVTIPNTGFWTDAAAARAFEGALARDVDLMVITPGAEKPLLMSQPVWALILQYKSFVAAANERLLVRSVQTRDLNVLHGLASAIALGVLSEYVYSLIVGRDMPKGAPDLIKAGISRSGALGWYQEANAISSKWTGGTADMFRLIGTERPDSRYISRSKLGALLGPTSNKVEALITTGSNVANLNWTAADTRRMRRFMIGQNLFYIRSALDKVEGGVNDAAGLEPMGQ